MSDVYHIEICMLGSGLCNQMFAVITGVIFAVTNRKHKLVIDGFQDDYSVYRYTPISEVLDLDAINCLIQSCGVQMFDSTFHPTDETAYYTMCCPTWTNQEAFDLVLRRIRFHPTFTSMAKSFTDQIEPGGKINALHIRMEDDAITHWSKSNQLGETEFREALAKRYIDIITEHISKTDVNIILSYSTDNAVLDFMKNNGYRFMLTDKNPTIGREKNAIVDTIVSQSCNNVMIGNLNVNDWLGSSFSYFIAKRLNDNVKCIMVDIRDLKIPNMVRMTPL